MRIIQERALIFETGNKAHTTNSWCCRWIVNSVGYFHVFLCALSMLLFLRVLKKIHFNIVTKSLLYVMLDIKLRWKLSQQYCHPD